MVKRFAKYFVKSGSIRFFRMLKNHSPRTEIKTYTVRPECPALLGLSKGVLLMLMSVFSIYSASNNPQEIFLRANKEYANGQYKKAYDLYQSIEQKGRAVWYNLGNCCYQLKQYPQAVALWRRAEEGASESEKKDIAYNIDRAREAEGYRPQKQPAWYQWLRATAAPFPLIVIQILFLLAWYALIWMLIIKRNVQGIKGMLMVTLLVCLLVWLSAVLFIQYQDTYYPRAVVHRQTAVYAGPHDRYHVIADLAVTDELKIIEQRTGWCKVMREQTYGWVPVYNLTIV